MTASKHRRRRRWRMTVLPAVCVITACASLVIHGLVSRNDVRGRYDLPPDRSAASMLRFMRELDGDFQPKRSRLLDTSNVKMTCQAMRAAWHELEKHRTQLSELERREADRYRLAYGVTACMGGHSEDLNEESGALLSIAVRNIQETPRLTEKEDHLVTSLIYVLERTSRVSEVQEIIQLVREKLDVSGDDGMTSPLARRLTAIERRLNLRDSQWHLASQTLQGEPLHLSDLRGKVVLVQFWSVNCSACIAELPALKRIYRTYASDGFEIVGVCIGATAARISKAVESHDLPWMQLCDDAIEGNAELSDGYGILAVPSTFLLDRQGIVVGVDVSPLSPRKSQDLEHQVRKLITSDGNGRGQKASDQTLQRAAK